jgi:hypothetical protein
MNLGPTKRLAAKSNVSGLQQTLADNRSGDLVRLEYLDAEKRPRIFRKRSQRARLGPPLLTKSHKIIVKKF